MPIRRPRRPGQTTNTPFLIGPPVTDITPATTHAGLALTNNELLFLVPGQRLDLMVAAPGAEGDYVLMQPDPVPPPGFGEKSRIGDLCPARAPLIIPPERLVMRVKVSRKGVPVNSAIPTQDELNALQAPTDLTAAPDAPAYPTQGVVYGFTSATYAPSAGGASVINGRPFNMERVQRVLKLGQMERWSVQSAADTHMFHIHTNSFQLIQRGQVRYDYPLWRDTVLINCAPTAEQQGSNCSFPGGLITSRRSNDHYGEVVQFLSRALDYTGAIVTHCHNVNHEDNGMMELVEMVE